MSTKVMQGMTFTAQLQKSCSSSWERAVNHPFTKELKDKRLSPPVFARYLLQDYAFLGGLLSAFGHALAFAPDLHSKQRLAFFMHHVCTAEVKFFHDSFQDLGVTSDTYKKYEALDVTASTDVKLSPTTAAFKEILQAASKEGYIQALAVLVPCEWIYHSWASEGGPGATGGATGGVTGGSTGGVSGGATRASEGGPGVTRTVEVQPCAEKQVPPDQDVHGTGSAENAWVGLHSDKEFSLFVAWLRSQLDKEAEAADTDTQARCTQLFHKVVELEGAFFYAAFDEAA